MNPLTPRSLSGARSTEVPRGQLDHELRGPTLRQHRSFLMQLRGRPFKRSGVWDGSGEGVSVERWRIHTQRKRRENSTAGRVQYERAAAWRAEHDGPTQEASALTLGVRGESAK